MAFFTGHLVPGLVFTLLGIWHMYRMCLRYFLSRKTTENRGKHSYKYTNSAVYPWPCLPKIPLEAIFKISIVPVGMVCEYVTGLVDGKFVTYRNLQHLTMYFFFGLTGFVDILTFYKAPIPYGSDYASGAMGFIVEGLLFSFHLHGRTKVDNQMHVILVYTIFGCAVAMAAESLKTHSLLSGLTRTFFVILQGTWLMQIAFLLYWPVESSWKSDSHDDIMLVTVFFCYHVAGIFIFTILMCFFTNWKTRRFSSIDDYSSLYPLSKFDPFDTRDIRNIIADSEEDEVI